MKKASDDIYFERTAHEIAAGNFSAAAWARALSEEAGDPQRSLAKYIKLRVVELASEAENIRRE